MTTESRPPVAPGEPAPDFSLPAVDRPGTVSLADYRGRSPVFLALFVGLWCPFCRRSIAQMGKVESKLKALGVEALGIVATAARERSALLQVPADPPAPGLRPGDVHAPRVRPAEAGADPGVHEGRWRRHGSIPTASSRRRCPSRRPRRPSAKQDGYTENDTDKADMDRQWPQLKGQFLIDRDGIVRWANIECATEGLAGVGKFPSEEEILTAARALPR